MPRGRDIARFDVRFWVAVEAEKPGASGARDTGLLTRIISKAVALAVENEAVFFPSMVNLVKSWTVNYRTVIGLWLD